MKMKFLLSALSSLCCAAVSVFAASDYSLKVTMTPKDGILQENETVTLRCRLLKKNQPAKGVALRVITRWERNDVASRDFPFDETHQECTVSYKGTKPGWVYFGFQVIDANGKVVATPGKQIKQRLKSKEYLYETGAVFSPEKIIAVDTYPADMEEFWAKEKQKVYDMPMKPELTEIPVKGKFKGKIRHWSLVVNCPGRYPVTGYMAIPVGAKKKSLPVIIDYQSLVSQDVPPTRVCHYAAGSGCAHVYVTWHGFPTGRKQSFYVKERYKTPVTAEIGKADKWFYHDMFLRAIRTLQFAKTLPEWNGKDLVVRGGSLGGWQSAGAAAVDHDVTMALVSVPGGCEFFGGKVGRRSGGIFKSSSNEKLLEKPAVARTAALHDCVNFAKMIKCETYVCTGFSDELCCPSGVYAFYNNIPAGVTKDMTTYPETGHYGTTSNTKGDARLGKGVGSALVQEDK